MGLECNAYTYLKVSPEALDRLDGRSNLQAKLSAIAEKYGRPFMAKSEIGVGPEDAIFDYRLQALSDIHLNSNYLREHQPNGNATMITILSTIALLVLFLACINFMNIGVRKVLGAQVDQILLLLSKDYFRLILMASVIALPLAFWGITTWLKSYAYAIELGIWFYVLPVLAVLFIAALTVCYQSIKVAFANPIKALRYE